jgi:hypothetical protein
MGLSAHHRLYSYHLTRVVGEEEGVGTYKVLCVNRDRFAIVHNDWQPLLRELHTKLFSERRC